MEHAMIRAMREAPDEFSWYLRKLRKDRGWSAHKLSKKMGKAHSYLGRWERGDLSFIDTDALAILASVLELSQEERRKLVSFARTRITHPFRALLGEGVDFPGDGAHMKANQSFAYENFAKALLSKKHEWPSESESHRHSSSTYASLIESMGWLICNWAAKSGPEEYRISNLPWPDSVRDTGILASCLRVTSKDLLQYDPSELLILNDQPEGFDETWTCKIITVANQYRYWLFADQQRCELCLEALNHWNLENELSKESLFVLFNDSIDQLDHGVDWVTSRVVSVVNKRSLMTYISTLSVEDKYEQQYTLVGDDVDSYPILFSRDADLSGMASEDFTSQKLLENIRVINDAIYVLSDSMRWSNPKKNRYRDKNIRFGLPGESFPEKYNLTNEEDRETLVYELRILIRKIRATIKKLECKSTTEP